MTEHTGIARYREVAQKLLSVPGVTHADIIEQDPRTGESSVEICVGPDFDRVPPRVHRKIAACDVGTVDQMRRDDRFVLVVA